MSASGLPGKSRGGESGGDDGDDVRAEERNRPWNQSMQGARRIIAHAARVARATIAGDADELEANGDDRRRSAARSPRGSPAPRRPIAPRRADAVAPADAGRRCAARSSPPKSRGCASGCVPTSPPRQPARNLFRIPSRRRGAGSRADRPRRTAAIGPATPAPAAAAAEARRHRRGSGRRRSGPHRDHLRRRAAVPREGRRDGDAALPRRADLRRGRRADRRRRRPPSAARSEAEADARAQVQPVRSAQRSASRFLLHVHRHHHQSDSGGVTPDAARARAELAPAHRRSRSGERRGVRHRARGHARELAAARRARAARGWSSRGAATARSTRWRRRSRSASTPLGIVPAGSGNGLARELGVAGSPSARSPTRSAPRRARSTRASSSGRLFFNVAGIGFDAHVAALFRPRRRRGAASSTYVAHHRARAADLPAATYRIDDAARRVTRARCS